MIQNLGRFLIYIYSESSAFLSLSSKSVLFIFVKPWRYKEFIQHLHFIAYQSLPMVLFCVSFASIVTIMESSFHMKLVVQNDSMVPGLASALILRELGAVVASLLLAARVGAGWAAEIGSMQVSEQVDALRLLGIGPIQYLVSPRLLASAIGGMLVSIIASLFCLYCAMLVSGISLGYGSGLFLSNMRLFVNGTDIIQAATKGLAFGSVIPLFSAYFGFRCKAGAEGVGNATTKAVVAIAVAIIVLDFFITWAFS